jgi:hypothetical protein
VGGLLKMSELVYSSLYSFESGNEIDTYNGSNVGIDKYAANAGFF